LSSLLEDTRHALRHLWRAKGFAFGVILVLGLSASASTTALGLLDAVASRPLLVPAADRLALISATDERGRAPQPIYFSTFTHIRSLQPFDRAALFAGGGLLWIEARGVTGEAFIEAVTPGYHESLGLAPHLGRFISTSDAPADGAAAAVAVISHGFWQRAYGGEARAIGEQLFVNRAPFTIVGVMPPEYAGLFIENHVDFAVPLGTLGRHLATNQYRLDPQRPLRAPNVVARLRPGRTIEQARASLEVAWETLRTESLPPSLSGDERRAAETSRVTLEPLTFGVSRLRARFGDRLRLFSAVTLTLVLVGALNVAGLMAARAAARDREIATHMALGATPIALMRRIVLECASLSTAASLLGAIVAWWATPLIAVALWDGAVPLQLSTTPRPSILLLAFVSAFAVSLVMSVGPAPRLWRADIGLVHAGRTATASIARIATPLVVIQVSLSMLLGVMAMMFTATLTSLLQLDTGVNGRSLRWTRLFQQPDGYRGMNDAAYYPELARTVAAIPGVHAVGLSHHFPAFYNFHDLVATYAVSRAESHDAAGEATAMMESISPDFFDTIGVPILLGRDFTWSDDRARQGVVIINQRLRDLLFGDQNPLGRMMRIGDDPSRQALEIVGVVRDATMGGYRSQHQPVAFRPNLQEPLFTRMPVIVFKTTLPAADADRAVAGAVRRMGREYVRRGYSFDEQVDIAMRDERLSAGVASGFAAVALILAGVGIFAQVAYAVARRARELAVRMALGATRAAIFWTVIRRGVVAALAGGVIGVPVSLAAAQLAQWRDVGIASPSPWLLAASGLFLVGAAAAASAVPAWRGALVAPATVLRDHVD